MLAHAVTVAADIDNVAMVHQSIDQGTGHDVVAEHLAPLVEAFVACEDGRGVLVAATHELEEEHRPGPRDRQIPDLVDDQHAGEDERLHPLREATGLLRLLQRGDQVGQGAVVDAPPALGRGNGETDRQVALADTGRYNDMVPIAA